jgi:hypothetical protein
MVRRSVMEDFSGALFTRDRGIDFRNDLGRDFSRLQCPPVFDDVNNDIVHISPFGSVSRRAAPRDLRAAHEKHHRTQEKKYQCENPEIVNKRHQ